MRARVILPLSVLLLGSGRDAPSALPTAVPNANAIPAGELRGGVLHIALDRLRLVAVQDSGFPANRPRMRLVIDGPGAGAPLPLDHAAVSPTIDLARDEPKGPEAATAVPPRRPRTPSHRRAS